VVVDLGLGFARLCAPPWPLTFPDPLTHFLQISGTAVVSVVTVVVVCVVLVLVGASVGLNLGVGVDEDEERELLRRISVFSSSLCASKSACMLWRVSRRRASRSMSSEGDGHSLSL
jgi:hypothetical protein